MSSPGDCRFILDQTACGGIPGDPMDALPGPLRRKVQHYHAQLRRDAEEVHRLLDSITASLYGGLSEEYPLARVAGDFLDDRAR